MYGEMHRYIPVIAKWAGFNKIGEKVIQHQERKFGETKFGIERFINGPLDLLVITFMSRFGKRPMHFFGVYGTLMFLLGGAVSTWLILEKVIALANQIKVARGNGSTTVLLSNTCHDHWNTIVHGWILGRNDRSVIFRQE